MRGRALCLLVCCFAGGIALGRLFAPGPVLSLVAALVLVVAAALALFLCPKAAPALLACAMLAVGCFAYAGAAAAVTSFPVAKDEPVRLVGRAAADSLLREQDRYRVLVEVEELNGSPWRGRVYVYYEGGPVRRGTVLAAQGTVLPARSYGNFAAFDYTAYLQRQGIAAAVSCYYGGSLVTAQGWAEASGSVRGRLLDAFEQAAGENSALLRGVFLGDKSGLSFLERTTLSLSGVLHAFAVSGLHVGFLVGAALLLAGAGRRRRWLRLLLVAALLAFYTSLTGWSASVLRAAAMALCLLLAQALDEKNDPYTGLALAALLCLIYRPLWLFDAGFQLSFAAALGLVYLLPLFRQLLQLGDKLRWLTELFAVTLAASFATMPLISYYFYHISFVGWLVSPLFVTGAGLAVLLCMLAALLAIFSANLAALPLGLADLLMRGLYALAARGAGLPGAYLRTGQTPLWAVLLFYAGLLALPVLWRRLRHKRLFTLAALLLLILLLSLAPLSQQPGAGLLEVVFLDVGQGDAALVITPEGHSILIDGGGRLRSPGTIGEQVLIPYLQARGLRGLDLLISSHPDADHADGLLSVLQYLPVGQLLYADAFPESALQQTLLEAAAANGAALTPAAAGMRFTLEPGLTLSIYHPPAGASYDESGSNDGSLVCLLSYGSIDFLFTGDSRWQNLPALPEAEIVKLPHHGSRSAYDAETYAALQAEAVVISAGLNNSYGHPHSTVVEYWQDKAEIYRTDWQGSITFYTDGKTWQAQTYLE